jgi:DNA-binding transcriptional LysR family regulator
MVCSMVANGFGYGLMNAPNMDWHAPDGKPLCYVPIEGNHRPLELGLITMRSERKSRILSAFEEHCRNRLPADHGPTIAAVDAPQGGPGKSG